MKHKKIIITVVLETDKEISHPQFVAVGTLVEDTNIKYEPGENARLSSRQLDADEIKEILCGLWACH